MPAGRGLRVEGAGRAAYKLRRMYRPLPRGARAARDLSWAWLALGLGRRTAAPLEHVHGLLQEFGLRGRAIGARTSWMQDRWVLAVADSDGITAIVKVGDRDDGRLRREAAMLDDLSRRRLGVGSLALLGAGEWSDRFAMVVAPLPSRARQVLDVRDATAAATALTRPADDGPPLLHNDMVSFNIWRDGDRILLIDWEDASTRRAPLWDLATFVVWLGARRRAWSPERAVELLTGPTGPGAQHLRAVGLSLGAAPDHLRAMLDGRSQARSDDVLRGYVAAMRRAV